MISRFEVEFYDRNHEWDVRLVYKEGDKPSINYTEKDISKHIFLVEVSIIEENYNTNNHEQTTFHRVGDLLYRSYL